MHPALAQLGMSADDIMRLPISEQQRLVELAGEYDRRRDLEECREKFMPFMRRVWPLIEGAPYVHGKHLDRLSDALERIERGTLKRLIVCMPPRHCKTMSVSKIFPAWFMGRNPSRKIIQAANTKDLAKGFGAVVRDLLAAPEYHEIFPAAQLKGVTAAKDDWTTTRSGEYYAVGVLGAMAGRGADVAIIDDPHNEREALIGLVRPEVYDSAFDWFRSGPRQRLQPGGAIIVCMTRWSKRDLVGQIIANDSKGEWEVIEFPAILPSGNALWPEFWPIAQLEATRDELRGLRWNAQYQQQPTATDLSLVKPTDWRPWQEANFMPRDPPRCTLVVQSWDTAHSAKKNANPSACTTWGLTEWENKPAVVLLHAWQDRVEFPDLKAKAKELYKQWKPDHVIVESQASGRPLISELRTSGVPVREFRAISGVDKFTRVNAVTDLFKSGFIHYIVEPDTTAVIEQFADFPSGSADDLVDSSTAALDLLKRNIAEYRQQQNREPGEEVQDDDDFQVRRRMRRAYY